MEGVPSGDIQAKYQKLAAEYSKVDECLNILRLFSNRNCTNSLFPLAVESACEGVKERRFRRASPK